MLIQSLFRRKEDWVVGVRRVVLEKSGDVLDYSVSTDSDTYLSAADHASTPTESNLRIFSFEFAEIKASYPLGFGLFAAHLCSRLT